jgi:hypothetical protein
MIPQLLNLSIGERTLENNTKLIAAETRNKNLTANL